MTFEPNQCVTIPLVLLAEIAATCLADRKADFLFLMDCIYNNLVRDPYDITNVPKKDLERYKMLLELNPKYVKGMSPDNDNSGAAFKNVISMLLKLNGYEIGEGHPFTDKEFNHELLEEFNFTEFFKKLDDRCTKDCDKECDKKNNHNSLGKAIEEDKQISVLVPQVQDSDLDKPEEQLSAEDFNKLKELRNKKFKEQINKGDFDA